MRYVVQTKARHALADHPEGLTWLELKTAAGVDGGDLLHAIADMTRNGSITAFNDPHGMRRYRLVSKWGRRR